MTRSHFLRHSEDALLSYAKQALDVAAALGCDAATATVSESGGISVQVRRGEPETITGDQSQDLDITVYRGKRRGSATTGELSAAAIRTAVEHASDLARFTGEDPDADLADPADLVAHPVAIDLFRPAALDADALAALAAQVERGALEAGDGIEIMSAGASSDEHRRALATSGGFAGAYSSSTHGAWCSAMARDGDATQGESWQEMERDYAALPEMATIGRYAAERAAARLNARSLSTRTAPVLFDATVAGSLIEVLYGALAGSAQHQQSTFLPDAVGKPVFAPHIDVAEDPFLPLGMASRPFDSDGVAGRARHIVRGGVAEGYFLSANTARKLGLRSTGNASGPHNLALLSSGTTPADDRDAMLRKLGTGLYLTGLTGQGINMVSGDYSRAAHGFWVEGGEIAYPVHEITIAGNLKDMFRDIVAVGSDTLRRGPMSTGSVLIESMRIAGR